MTRPAKWREHAACKGVDSELFFPVSGKREHATEALQVCAACPVRQACLDDAVERGDDWAVLGGHTAKERQAMRGDVALKHVRQAIRYHLDRGRTDTEIATRVGCGVAAVAQIRASRYTADRDAAILRLAADGASSRAIAAQLGIGREVVRGVLTRAARTAATAGEAA